MGTERQTDYGESEESVHPDEVKRGMHADRRTRPGLRYMSGSRPGIPELDHSTRSWGNWAEEEPKAEAGVDVPKGYGY